MNERYIFLIMAALLTLQFIPAVEAVQVERWDVYELSLNGPSSGNPYLEVNFKADFKNGTRTVSVPGFYDGEGKYKVRFSPDMLGEWSFTTKSNTPQLDGKTGSFQCVKPTGNNHGPLKIVNTYYLEYADGFPFYSVGTTAYQWTSVTQSIQEQTLHTLANSPFNKIRMCVFPKSYKYGNDTEPWAYPYSSINNFDRPNYAFFQNFDRRIKQLMDLGVQADVILFHPYDKWGYSKMGNEKNFRYVRYMIARISAYRNVWWSLANEWDVPSIKESIDWEGIGTLLQKEDPHQRFRGIHNWYDTEDHFYDYTRPWITHTCTQTSRFYNAVKWRERYKKPLLFDEMRYEGDVESSWGNMSSEEMTSYFWMAGLSGGYGTHGDTYKNASDDETEVRWWAKGGMLVGKSPERIAFFKSFMEAAPVKEMEPLLADNGQPENKNNNVYIFKKEGEIYLAYVADANIEINLNLTGDAPYTWQVIDAWNMTTTSKGEIQPGDFHYRTQNKYEAVCLKVKK